MSGLRFFDAGPVEGFRALNFSYPGQKLSGVGFLVLAKGFRVLNFSSRSKASGVGLFLSRLKAFESWASGRRLSDVGLVKGF